MPTQVALRRELPNIVFRTSRDGCCTSLVLDYYFFDAADRMPPSERLKNFITLASDRCFAAGRRADVWSCAGPVRWQVFVPHTDAQQTLDALAALALEDPGPLDALVAQWSIDPAPTAADRMAARASSGPARRRSGER